MDHSSIQLRRAGIADAEALAAFAARTFSEAFGADNRPEDMAAHLATAYGLPQQSRELQDPAYITLLLTQAADLAAFAQIRRHPPPPCVRGPAPVELYRFYVDRVWQGLGLAQRLIRAAHAAALELGGRTLWLSVWKRNPRAIAFYAKCGFDTVGTADFHVGLDRQIDWIMERGVARDTNGPG